MGITMSRPRAPRGQVSISRSRPFDAVGRLRVARTVGWQKHGEWGVVHAESWPQISTARTSTSNRLGCWPLVTTGVVLFFHSWLSRLTSSRPLVGVAVPIAMTGGERPSGPSLSSS